MKALCLASALLAGCVAPAPSPAGAGEIEAARQTVFACHLRQVPVYDDHASDAATVGAAVAQACMGESNAWFAAQVRGQNQYRIDALGRTWKSLNRDLATSVVLAMRAHRP